MTEHMDQLITITTQKQNLLSIFIHMSVSKFVKLIHSYVGLMYALHRIDKKVAL